jgi:pyridoxal phosphate enzyme (YggS family)
MPITLKDNDLIVRLRGVEERVKASALAAGRDPGDVTLVAVSKTHPAERLQDALAVGLRDFGENRVQEAEGKIDIVGRRAARWHLIGHLQGNKARKAVQLFDIVHSVDSVELASRLDRICVEEGREELPVLIQVDLAGEETKNGVREDQVSSLIDWFRSSLRLRLVGLMTIPPYFEDPELVRPYFRRLRELRDELRKTGAFDEGTGELSMGMSHDFEIAVEEGATMIRVGTAIFGSRN